MWRSFPLTVNWAAQVMAQVSGTGDIPGWLLAVGSAIGGIFVTVLSGKLVVPTFAYSRERERADFWQGEYMTLSKQINTQVVTALAESGASVRESTETTKQAIAVFGRRDR